MFNDDKIYPLPAFYFSVDIGGAKSLFSEVSGLTVEHEDIKYRHGASKAWHVMKMPGLRSVGDVTLKRGIVEQQTDLYTWLAAIQLNVPYDRKTVTIALLNDKHETVMAWKLGKAWPKKVEGPSLKSDSNEVAFESVVLAFETMEISNG